jgi:hypothetical protein
VDRREGRCFHCKRKGHLARNCKEERVDSRERGRDNGRRGGRDARERIRISISPSPSWYDNESCATSEREKDTEKRVRKALDNRRKERGGGGGGARGGKRRSPSPYSYDSRSYSKEDSYKRKGRKSRSNSQRKKGGSRSAGSKSGGSLRQYSKHSVRSQESPRGEIKEDYPSRVLRSKTPEEALPETNGHVEDKNPEAAATEQPPVETAGKD